MGGVKMRWTSLKKLMKTKKTSKKASLASAKATTEVLQNEKKIYKPAASVLKHAVIKNAAKARREAEKDRLAYWAKAARELSWYKPFKSILDKSKAPFYQWFKDGQCNIVANAIDRHLGTATEKKTAILWESDMGKKRRLTYGQLNREVCRLANGLKHLGIKKGDRVAIYLQNTPEAAISMLACAKIGAVHSVVYAGFSAHALADRMNDQQAKVLITSDIGHRRGKTIDMKTVCDEAATLTKSLKHL
ncbi:AMP-binding protein, partial [Candidatus Parvarchaeota archaeon]|nr:AMP-binding protein [Candidatus Parvarchaeota archaeon]